MGIIVGRKLPNRNYLRVGKKLTRPCRRSCEDEGRKIRKGPITCGIDATDKWQNYESGIYSESKLILDENHEISVIGWASRTALSIGSAGTAMALAGRTRLLQNQNAQEQPRPGAGVQLGSSRQRAPHYRARRYASPVRLIHINPLTIIQIQIDLVDNETQALREG